MCGLDPLAAKPYAAIAAFGFLAHPLPTLIRGRLLSELVPSFNQADNFA